MQGQPIEQALGFKKSNKEIYKTHFKNSVTTVYMKNRDCGNLEIPEVHPAVSFKGGQKDMHENSVDAICANPQTDKEFATGSHDHTIKLWDAPKYGCKATLRGHEKGVWAVNYSHDGKQMISASPDWTAKIWDAKQGKCVDTLKGHTHFCFKAAFSPDGTKAATVGADCLLNYWDLRSTKAPVFSNKDSANVLMAVDFMPGGHQLVATSIAGEIAVVDVASQQRQFYHDTMPGIIQADKENRALFEEQREQMQSVEKKPTAILSNIIYCVKALAHDDGVFLYGAQDANVTKCAVGNLWTETVDLFSGHSSGVRSVEASKDGKKVVTGCEDHSLRVWDYETGKAELLFSGHHDVVSGGSFLNENTLVSSSWDMTVKIWKI